MKRIFSVLLMVMMFAFAGVCAAADGADLNKEQKTAEKLNAMLSGQELTYTVLSADMSAGLKENFKEEALTEVKKQAKEKLGTAKSITFRSFERYDDGDVVRYIGSFSKEKLVAIIYVFDKNQKLNLFSFTPVEEAKK